MKNQQRYRYQKKMIELHADFTVQGSGLTINPQWSLLLQSLMKIFCVYVVGRVSWKSSALTARVVGSIEVAIHD